MNYKYVIDSFAWVEYFRGSKKGETVRNCLEEGGNATPTIVLAELSDVYEREKNKFWERDCAFIASKTALIGLGEEIASSAGKIKNEIRQKFGTRFGLADAIVLATSKRLGAKVVTGDLHFKNLENVIFL